jgi:hypothetical protein
LRLRPSPTYRILKFSMGFFRTQFLSWIFHDKIISGLLLWTLGISSLSFRGAALDYRVEGATDKLPPPLNALPWLLRKKQTWSLVVRNSLGLRVFRFIYMSKCKTQKQLVWTVYIRVEITVLQISSLP